MKMRGGGGEGDEESRILCSWLVLIPPGFPPEPVLSFVEGRE
jgi:hypothetical protein